MIHLGFEIDSGNPVSIPIRHMAVTGQTQEAGKTTTLEALITRGAAGGLRAVAFVTKRGERSFQIGTRIKPYFKERADWRFLASLLEATMAEKLKFERPWIIRAAKGAKTLADVQRNVRDMMEKSKRAMDADQYLKLDEYLKIVVPQIDRLPYSETLNLKPGLNIMDLGGYSSELQGLVIRSVLEWVYEHEEGVVVVIPEAWEFIPQKRGSPVKLAAEEFIRKGASLRNYLWLDSQDIAGVETAVRKSVIVWLLGVQREENEVKRTLSYIIDAPKPKVDDIMRLGKGEFFACFGKQVRRVYVQPAWMTQNDAIGIARGERVAERLSPRVTAVSEIVPEEVLPPGIPGLTDDQEDDMSAEEREKYERTIAEQEQAIAQLQIQQEAHARDREVLKRQLASAEQDAQIGRDLIRALRAALGRFTADMPAPSIDALIAKVMERMPKNGAIYQITPPEALRKEFQQKEVERILAAIDGLESRIRDALRLLEGSGQWIGIKNLAARIGAPILGDSFSKFSKRLNEIAEREEFVERQERQGVRGRLKEKIAADLAYYQASPEEIEQTYQHCLAVLAREAVTA